MKIITQVNPQGSLTGNAGKRLRLLLFFLAVMAAFPPLDARAASVSLVISEVMYDPLGAEPDNEWIEMYNLGAAALDLSGYKVGDEEESGGNEGMMQFPGGVIASGTTVVIANKASAFFSMYGFNPDYEFIDSDAVVPDMVKYTPWSSGSVTLANTSDEMLLLGGGDSIVDAVSWGGSTFAFDPAAPDVAAGSSLARQFADVDTDAAADWMELLTPGPGQVTTGTSPVPLPPAAWLFVSGLMGLAGLGRRRREK